MPDHEEKNARTEKVEADDKKEEKKEDACDVAEKNEKPEENQKEKKPKIDPKDWPMRDIKEPSDNDVLFGRGGGTNHAKGNKRYRKMVEDRKLEYVNSKRLDKPLVALEIIRLWRAQDPPGRFLKLDSNGTWTDVGDKKAREKTSQALREKAPLIRKQQEEERVAQEGAKGGKAGGDDKEQSTKTTRFAEGTSTESKGGVKKAVLARDHSLGREYLHAGETVNLEGFSWRDPFDPKSGSKGSCAHSTKPPPPPPPFSEQRMNSGGRGLPPPSQYRLPSGGPPPPPMACPPPIAGPPPPGGFHRTPTDEYRQPYQNAPMIPGYTGYGPQQRSGSWSWTHSPAHAMPPLREHSLSQNPLRNASASHAAPLNAFDGRSGSGYWGDPRHPPPPPAVQQTYGGHFHEGSGSYAPARPPTYDEGRGYNTSMKPPPPVNVSPPPHPPQVNPQYAPSGNSQYSVDPAIAKTWSGQSDEGIDISKVYDRPKIHTSFGGDQHHAPGCDPDQDQSDLPKPQLAKRMTSNQNETFETKPDLCGPSVKRAALNRDNSLASNRLKATHLPEYYTQNGKFDTEHEMNVLTDNMEQSTLDYKKEKPQPKTLVSTERTSTLEHIAMDLMVKPNVITDSSRSSTIEALALDDLDADPVLKPGAKASIPKPSALDSSNRMTTMEACFADLESAKPLSLGDTDRISTTDYLNIGDEAPLTEIDFDKM